MGSGQHRMVQHTEDMAALIDSPRGKRIREFYESHDTRLGDLVVGIRDRGRNVLPLETFVAYNMTSDDLRKFQVIENTKGLNFTSAGMIEGVRSVTFQINDLLFKVSSKSAKFRCTRHMDSFPTQVRKPTKSWEKIDLNDLRAILAEISNYAIRS